jgi:hypothetical protein
MQTRGIAQARFHGECTCIRHTGVRKLGGLTNLFSSTFSSEFIRQEETLGYTAHNSAPGAYIHLM